MIVAKNNKGILRAALIIWAVICVFQAFYTELHPDEAYYWVYSENIEWGHFHQPPMVAAFIKAGYSIFKNELGVRLLFVLAHLATIVLLYKLIQPKKIWLFILGLGSLFLLHASSLLAVPDTVLIFFTISFFYFLRDYSKKPNIKTGLILGLLAGGILLSKYHGGVVLLIALIANLKYFKHTSFYLVIIISSLLFVPHILWLIDHDWITFKFHLFNRDDGEHSYSVILEYILGQILLLGPFGVLLLLQTIKQKSSDSFNRTLRIIGISLFLFFFALSFTHRIEANWTASAYLCLLIVGYKDVERDFDRKWLYTASAVLLCVFMLLRVEVMTGALFPKINDEFKYKHYKAWAHAIQNKADGKPVVFTNSYQYPSLYMFYSDELSTSYNSCISPGNQFDLYDFPSVFNSKTVLEVEHWKTDCGTEAIQYSGKETCYRIIEDYRDLSAVWIDIEAPETSKPNDTIGVSLIIKHRQTSKTIDLSPRGTIRPELMLSWLDPDNNVIQSRTKHFVTMESFDKKLHFKIKSPKSANKYRLAAGIAIINHFPSRNSYICNIEVKE